MQKKFLINLLLLIFINLLIKPFWILGIDRGVQNAVGTSEYGLYYALFNFSFLFNMLLDSGITNFNNRNISQNEHLLSKYLSNIVTLKLILSFFYILITLSAGYLMNYNPYQMKLLIVLAFNQAVISFFLYLRSNLSGMHLFNIDSMLSVLDKVLMIILITPLLWINMPENGFNIEMFIYLQTVSYVLSAVIAWAIVVSKSKFKSLKLDIGFFILIMKESFPFALLALLMTVYNKIDVVMLERMLHNGSEEAGIYAASYRLLDAVGMFGFLFASLLFPIFSRFLKNKESVEPLLGLAASLLIIPACVVCFSCFFYRQEIMSLFYKESTGRWAEIFGFLIWSFLAISVTYIYGTLLTANYNLTFLNYIAAAGMIINIGLNFVLIPRYSSLGAAYSTLISLSFVAIAQLLFAKKIFNLKMNFRFIILLTIFITCLFFINLYTINLANKWFINFIIALTGGFLMALVLKLINVKMLLGLLKERKE